MNKKQKQIFHDCIKYFRINNVKYYYVNFREKYYKF